MDCEMIERCPFFLNSDVRSKAVEMLKTVYCKGSQEGCARHMIATTVGREFVPPSLYPNEVHKVSGIIKKSSVSWSMCA